MLKRNVLGFQSQLEASQLYCLDLNRRTTSLETTAIDSAGSFFLRLEAGARSTAAVKEEIAAVEKPKTSKRKRKTNRDQEPPHKRQLRNFEK